MKLKLEIDIPEYEWVDVPTLYKTPIGNVSDSYQLGKVRDLIEYIQRLNDRQAIIELDCTVRQALCMEWIRTRLDFIPDVVIFSYAEKLSNFLRMFQEHIGYDFDAYVFEYTVLSNGKKIQFKTFSMTFDTEEEAFRHIVKIHTSKSDFEFAVDQGDQHGAPVQFSRKDQSGTNSGSNGMGNQGEKTDA